MCQIDVGGVGVIFGAIANKLVLSDVVSEFAIATFGDGI
jgi:hypothetical protein